jgi:hypothetical protein
MATQLTENDFRETLTMHLAGKGAEIHEKFGPVIGWRELAQILEDRTCVRYPCGIEFDSTPLRRGEFAHPVQHGDRPEEGFTIYVHPVFMTQLDQVPLLVLYQLVRVNYGEFASAEDLRVFGAAALGMAKDDYYDALCELADQVGGGCCG